MYSLPIQCYSHTEHHVPGETCLWTVVEWLQSECNITASKPDRGKYRAVNTHLYGTNGCQTKGA